MTTIEAQAVTVGSLVTDQYGHSYHVAAVLPHQAGGAGVYLMPVGQNYPEFYLNDSPIRVIGTQPLPDPTPYYCLTRRYNNAGDCLKGERRFATRQAMNNWIAKAPASVVITAHN